MRKKIGITFFFGVLLASVAWFNLAPIIPPPGAAGSTGPQGSPGISGSPGPEGSPGPSTGKVIDTAGAPDNGVGANGDYAFDDATKTIYGPKAAGVWPAGVVLGGGGVIGTASFSGGDPVSNFVNDGVISAVAYSSLGIYTVTLTGQADANYIPLASSIDSAGNGVTANIRSKATGGFEIYFYDPRGEVSFDPSNVNVAVLRLSQ